MDNVQQPRMTPSPRPLEWFVNGAQVQHMA